MNFCPLFPCPGLSHLLVARILQIVSTSAPIYGIWWREFGWEKMPKVGFWKKMDMPRSWSFVCIILDVVFLRDFCRYFHRCMLSAALSSWVFGAKHWSRNWWHLQVQGNFPYRSRRIIEGPCWNIRGQCFRISRFFKNNCFRSFQQLAGKESPFLLVRTTY